MRFTLSFLLVLFLVHVAVAQPAEMSDQQQIKQAINQLFDGMRASDSSMVQAVFLENATMKTVGRNRDGEVILNETSVKQFVAAVGGPKEDIWDERLDGIEIKIDGDLASVWTPYRFFRGDTFSHCGVNSFQMMKTEEGWKVINIVDTRRRQGCES